MFVPKLSLGVALCAALSAPQVPTRPSLKAIPW